MITKSLDVELQLTRLADSAHSDSVGYDIVLIDHSLASPKYEAGSVRFYRGRSIPGPELTLERFIDDFAQPGQLLAEDGLRFGTWLEDTLFAPRLTEMNPQPAAVRVLWDDLLQRAQRGEKPLRLQVSFPDKDRGLAEDLPFELLARDGVFYFRRNGWTLVRSFQGIDGVHEDLKTDARIAVLWANPRGNDGDADLPRNRGSAGRGQHAKLHRQSKAA